MNEYFIVIVKLFVKIFNRILSNDLSISRIFHVTTCTYEVYDKFLFLLNIYYIVFYKSDYYISLKIFMGIYISVFVYHN